MDKLMKMKAELEERENKGFTLMEMLIVVAIIAVLVAIAIPVFTNQLEKAVNGLRERGFTDIRSMEIIRRGMEVHPGGVRPSFEMLGHTGYLTFARKRSV